MKACFCAASGSGPGHVPDDLDQRARIDIIEMAEDIHMPRRSGMRPDESGVVPERGLIVRDADAAALVEI